MRTGLSRTPATSPSLPKSSTSNIPLRNAYHAYQLMIDEHGEDTVKQRRKVIFAERTIGGIILIDGAPGTGKSKLLLDHIVLRYSFATLTTSDDTAVRNLADVRLVTLNNYAQGNVHGDIKTNLVIIDEAGKAAEPDALAGLIYVDADALIMAGDFRQIPPRVVDCKKDEATGKIIFGPAFNHQLKISCHQRLLFAGLSSIRLSLQHRFPRVINNLLKQMGYDDLQSDPAVDRLDRVRKAKGIVSQIWPDLDGNVALIDIPHGVASKGGPGADPSVANSENVHAAFAVYLVLIKAGGYTAENAQPASITIEHVHLYDTIYNAMQADPSTAEREARVDWTAKFKLDYEDWIRNDKLQNLNRKKVKLGWFAYAAELGDAGQRKLSCPTPSGSKPTKPGM